ncbi:MAG: OmpA family protein [Cyclobacteriaceae bacterium]
MIKSTLYTIIFFSGFLVFSQESLILKSADRDFENFAYSEAVEKYEFLHKKDTNNIYYVEKIIESYVKLNKSNKAEIWLETLTSDYVDYDNYMAYIYGQVLSENKKYEEAKYWYEVYKNNGGTLNAEIKLDGINNLENFFLDNDKVKVEKLPFNTEESDFAPFFLGSKLGFVSARKEKQWVKNTYNWDESEYLDFYYYDANDTSLRIRKIKSLNSKYHEGPAEVYDQGNKIVFTRNNTNQNRLRKDQKGVTRLQLFFATLDTIGRWNDIQPFRHNNKDYSLGHPTISSNGKFLIFTSDMPGGFGGTDLYYSVLESDTSWSIPINLGATVNTAGNEMFPFLDAQYLWFASDGLDGLGGLDIYMIEMDQYTTKGEPQNVGAPINSSQDDFSFITNKDHRSGYFASDRDGDDDIFQFTKEYLTITGKVQEKETGKSIPQATVFAMNSTGDTLGSILSDSNGGYQMDLPKTAGVLITAKKNHFSQVGELKVALNSTLNSIVLDPLVMVENILEVNAAEEKSGELISNAFQVVATLENSELAEAKNESKNLYYVLAGEQYLIVSAKEGFYTKRDTVSLDTAFMGTKRFTAKLKKIVIGESIRLDHIYYDVNSANLRLESEVELDKVVVFMQDNSHIKIELSSHTDSRGSASYNQRLSQKRAESATQYLIDHGIEKDRIIPKGYGERKLVNRCSDGVRCSAGEHQENRRTEIKILKNE